MKIKCGSCGSEFEVSGNAQNLKGLQCIKCEGLIEPELSWMDYDDNYMGYVLDDERSKLSDR